MIDAPRPSDFTVPLDGSFRIEIRGLQRSATGESVVTVEVMHGATRLAGGCVPVAFADRWADALASLVADLATPADFLASQDADPSALPASTMLNQMAQGGA